MTVVHLARQNDKNWAESGLAPSGHFNSQ